MRFYLIIAIASLFVLPATAQRFKPYHAFGLQANLKGDAISKMGHGYYGGPQLTDFKLYPDILASYDYGFLKWLGLSSGIGFRGWGGSHKRVVSDFYYLTVPLKLQLKAGFFWIEPKIEHNLFLWQKRSGESPQASGIPYTKREHIQTSYWTYGATFRVNLFRGLSTNFGMSFSLSDALIIPHPNNPENAYVRYNAVQMYAGIRYMFNQPYE